MAGTLNANYIQADINTSLNLNASNNSGSIIAPVPLYSGSGAASPLGGATNPTFGAVSSANNYIQAYIYNTANGAYTSSDFSAYPANGTDANGWIDMGITSLAFNQPGYSVTGPNEGYIFMSAPGGSNTSGNLIFSTDSTGTKNSHQWYTCGFNKAKNAPAMTLDGATGNLLLANNLTFTGSNAGINFNNSGAVGASLLNDYETGTWTPVFETGSTQPGSLTYVNRAGNYTKMGRYVIAWFYMNITVSSAGSGNPAIVPSSLPFVPRSDSLTNSASTRGGYVTSIPNSGGYGAMLTWNNANPSAADALYMSNATTGGSMTTGAASGVYAGYVMYEASF